MLSIAVKEPLSTERPPRGARDKRCTRSAREAGAGKSVARCRRVGEDPILLYSVNGDTQRDENSSSAVDEKLQPGLTLGGQSSLQT